MTLCLWIYQLLDPYSQKGELNDPRYCLCNTDSSPLCHLRCCSDTYGSVESVKAASDVYMPVAGEVVEVNSVSSLVVCPRDA